MQVMWWGSMLQSLSTDLFLALRHSSEYHSAKFYKRLDLSESSTGENSAFVDNWIRTDYFDFPALAKWCQKAAHDSLVVIDLWGFVLAGKDIAAVGSQLQSICESCGGLIFLLPKMHVADWYDKVERDYSVNDPLFPMLQERINAAKKTYEYLLNSTARFGMIESAPFFKDFCASADLDLSKTRKFAGLVHLVPKQLSWGPLGFTAADDFCNGILRMFDRVRDEADWNLMLNLRNSRLESFVLGRQALDPDTRGRGYPRRSIFVRRRDGVFAFCSSWSLYLSTVARVTAGLGQSSSLLEALDRIFLVFLAQLEGSLVRSSSFVEERGPADFAAVTTRLSAS